MSTQDVSGLDEILAVIRSLGRQNLALGLSKSFKGVVLDQKVSVYKVNPDSVTFRVDDVRLCAALEGYVHLHSRLFPKPVVAHLTHLNVCNGMLVLSGFVYIDTDWKERQHERVQTQNPTYVTLRWKGKVFSACMENISVKGMGLLAYKLFERGMKIQPGSNARLDFQLSPEDRYTSVRGVIVYLHPLSSLWVKLGIRLFPSARQARSLEKYIAHRKDEIMEELDRNSYELSRPRGVESLYF